MADGETTGTAHKYSRVLLKISGESLMGHRAYGIDTEMVASVAKEVKNVVAGGVEVCLVVVVAISSGVFRVRRPAWNAPPAIIWACWQP